jgi:hypothetical protein
MARQAQDDHPHLIRVLEPGEQIRVKAVATDAVIAVTDNRLLVADRNRVALAVPLEGIRRVQFDIERRRPATLVIVPESAAHEPRVLVVPPEQYGPTAQALVALGLALTPVDQTARSASGEAR